MIPRNALLAALVTAMLPAIAAAQTAGQVSNPVPANGAVDVPATTALSWAAAADARRYDVRLGTTPDPPIVERNLNGTSYQPPSALSAGTTYYWRIDARGRGNAITPGPLWSFTTAAPLPPSATLDRLRLMTWNVRMGRNAANVMNIGAQVELMGDSGAHVIVLEEVTISVDGNLPQLYETGLETLTGLPWNAVWAPRPLPSTNSSEGILILSRLPIVSSATHQIDTDPGDPTFLDAKRSVAQAAVIVNGVRVNVFGTHLALNATHRQMQLDLLQTWVSTFPEPRLVGGDFNFVAGDAPYADMAGMFGDVWPALAGADPGFTMDLRSVSGAPGRIDQWWQEKTDLHARATEITVLKTKRSDHHAVVVDIDVK